MTRKDQDRDEDDDEPRANSPADLGYGAPATARKPVAKDEGPRNFNSIFSAIGDGELHDEAGEQFHEVLKELKHHTDFLGARDAKGSITIKIGIQARADGSVVLAGDVSIKKPTRKRGGSTLFFTPGANLTLENPRQQKLPLRELPGGNRAVKDIPDAPRVVR